MHPNYTLLLTSGTPSKSSKVEETIGIRFDPIPSSSSAIQLRAITENKTENRIVSYRAFDILEEEEEEEDLFRVERDVRRIEEEDEESDETETKSVFLERKEEGEGERRITNLDQGCQLGEVARCPVMRRARRCPDDEAPALYTSTTHNANKLHTI